MTNTFYIDTTSASAEILKIFSALSARFPEFSLENGTIRLDFTSSEAPNQVKVESTATGYAIAAQSTAEIMRGIGLAIAGQTGVFSTTFNKRGVMLDVSRNKVFTVDYVKKFILQLALSGANMLMLYAEDTYQLEDVVFWGYARGAYSLKDIQEIDDFAYSVGVEVIGCIQTLGHMTQFLQWPDSVYYRDTKDILLIDSDKTYELIEKMLLFWKKALRTNRIHIGMDEAHDLGHGRWLNNHAPEPQSTLFTRHLTKVNELCRKHGFEMPTIWNDMFFRMADPNHDYYGRTPIPPEVQKLIPENVQLCYWDYYHRDKQFYLDNIDLNVNLVKAPLMLASGLWTWRKFWYDENQSQQSVKPCLEACLERKVPEILFTLWGDDGGYCLYDSLLPGIIHAFNQCWNIESDAVNERLFTILSGGEDYRKWMDFGRMESEGSMGDRLYAITYEPCAQLWDDPILGFNHRGMCKIDPEFPQKVMKTYRELLAAYPEAPEDSLTVRTITALLKYLEQKVTFRVAIEKAWQEKDRTTLKHLADDVLPELKKKLLKFDALHRDSWLACASPFGLEVIQIRLAGQATRLDECRTRLNEFLDGKYETLPEFDESMAPMPVIFHDNMYHSLSSGSAIN